MNAGSDRSDTATRETYYNPDMSRDAARDVLCGNSRLQAFPGFIAGSRWLTVYLHIVDEFRGVTRSSAGAHMHISMWIRILYRASNIYFVISKRQNGGAYIEKFRAIFKSRKLMLQVVNNSPMWLLPTAISIMDIMKRRCKRCSFINAMMHYRREYAGTCY